MMCVFIIDRPGDGGKWFLFVPSDSVTLICILFYLFGEGIRQNLTATSRGIYVRKIAETQSANL